MKPQLNKFKIRGGKKLYGRVVNQTSKNATLPILSASLMCNGITTINAYPQITDLNNMLSILSDLGVKIYKTPTSLILNPLDANLNNINFQLMKTMRSSIFLLGSMLARFKTATITQPGGCRIGKRGIDIHLAGLKRMGVKIVELGEEIFFDASNAHSAKITLKFPSVGATENLIQFAALTKGKTQIINAAREPEIVDLCNFLIKTGAKIKGAGTNKITIRGVNELKCTQYTPIGDRIAAGTIMVAVAISGGKVTIENAAVSQNENLIEKLKRIGCQIETENDILTITSEQGLSALGEISTGCYPLFPTDMQSQMLSLACFLSGQTEVKENVFENRLQTAHELNKMGAKISLKSNKHAIVTPSKLHGAHVDALDLRGGASLVLAGLGAKGVTIVSNVQLIDRGYVSLEKTLASLGADIERI